MSEQFKCFDCHDPIDEVTHSFNLGLCDSCSDDIKRDKFFMGFSIAVAISLIFGFLVFFVGCNMANAEEVLIDMKKIAMIESSNNPLAHNKNDDSRGLYQITPICLKDYNNFNKTSYTMNDLWDVSINTKIANWYFTKRIPQLLKHFKKADTVSNRIICWNAGISYVVSNKKLPITTIKYLKKYGV